MFSRRNLVVGGVLLALSVASPAMAGDDDDHDAARRAVARGEALPLERMLVLLRRVAPGEMIDLEFERDGGRWVYEFKVLAPNGVVREVTMEARTGRVLEIEIDD